MNFFRIKKREENLRKAIFKSFGVDISEEVVDIEKGRGLPIGTRKVWSGEVFEKTPSGECKYIGKEGKVSKGESKEVGKLSDTSKTTFPTNLDELEDLGSLGGSSDVRKKRDKSSGIIYAVKKARERTTGEDQLREEDLANKLYKLMGIPVLDTKVYRGGEYLVSPFIEGVKYKDSNTTLKEKAKKELYKGFVMDALLGNWDVIGVGGDNLLIVPGGDGITVYRTDNGSSLRFRARGGLKPSIESDVKEIDSFRNEVYDTGKIFKDIPDSEIKSQVKDIVKKKDEILSLLPSELKKVMGERIEYLENRFLRKGEEKKEAPKEELKEGMPSLITQKYFEDWDKLELEGTPEIKETIRKNILRIEEKYQGKYREYAKSHGISVEEYKQKLQDLVEELVEKSECFTALHSGSVMRSIFSKNGRFKSQFETGTSRGALSPSYRAETEYEYFGFPDDIEEDKEFRPIYGYPTPSPNGVINEKGTIPPPVETKQYGDVYAKVNQNARNRKTTITFMDSLGRGDRMVASPMSKPHFTSLPMVTGDPLKELENIKKKGSYNIGTYGYAECQFHNKLELSDIESIHIGINNFKSGDSIDFVKLNNIINTFKDFVAETSKKEIDIKLF